MSTKATYYLILGLVIFSSCKKGDEDPALTLATRTSRICGEWKLSNIQTEAVYNRDEEGEVSVRLNGDGNQINELQVWGKDSTWITSTINSYTITINRDGTWSKTIDVNVIDKLRIYGAFSTITSTFRQETISSGTWAFVHKTNDQYKNKERVQFTENEYNIQYYEGTVSYDDDKNDNPPTIESMPGSGTKYTTENVGGGTVYDLVMLKSKQMKWKIAFESKIYDLEPDPESLINTSNSIQNLTWEAK
jgi:hypothetical protein